MITSSYIALAYQLKVFGDNNNYSQQYMLLVLGFMVKIKPNCY